MNFYDMKRNCIKEIKRTLQIKKVKLKDLIFAMEESYGISQKFVERKVNEFIERGSIKEDAIGNLQWINSTEFTPDELNEDKI